MCAISWCDLYLSFDLGSAKMFFIATFDKYFVHHKTIWMAPTDYYVEFYLIVLSLTDTLLLINRSVNNFLPFDIFCFKINIVIFRFNSRVLIFHLYIHFVVSFAPYLHNFHCQF